MEFLFCVQSHVKVTELLGSLAGLCALESQMRGEIHLRVFHQEIINDFT